MTQKLSSKIRFYWCSFYAYVIGAAFGFLLWLFVSDSPVERITSVMSYVYNATLQYSCVSVGFTSTVITIVFSLRESRVMHKLQVMNKYALEHLKSLLLQVFVANWIALVLALLRPLFELKVKDERIIIVLLVFAIIDAISALLTFRMVRVLLGLFLPQKPIVGE